MANPKKLGGSLALPAGASPSFIALTFNGGVGMTTIQIAKEKELFLEKSISLLKVENEKKYSTLAEDIEYITQDTIGLFPLLLHCDEHHQLAAVTSNDYPYQAVEETLDNLFIKFLELCDELSALMKVKFNMGYEIKNRNELEAVRAKARHIVEDDETFYESERYRSITARAMAEYQKGQMEEWP